MKFYGEKLVSRNNQKLQGWLNYQTRTLKNYYKYVKCFNQSITQC